MKKSVSFIILAFLLVSCQLSPKNESLVVATKTPIPKPSDTPVPPSPTATEKPMTLAEQVDAFAAGKIEFPSNLTQEQYSAIIKEMNQRRGSMPMWVEVIDQGNNPIVWYHDNAKNQMVKLPGTYDENKAEVDKNSLDAFVEIYIEPDTGNLQYVHPDTGEVITVPNSANMNWNLVVDKTNYKSGIVDFPNGTRVGWQGDFTDYLDYVVGGIGANGNSAKELLSMLPIVLMDNTPLLVTKAEGGGMGYGDGVWLEEAGLEMLFIRTDTNGKPLYAMRTFTAEWDTWVSEEGGNSVELIPLYYGTKQRNKEVKALQTGAIYYVGLYPNQSYAWHEMNRDDIDNLQNVVSKKESFIATTKQAVPTENIVLTILFLIKKK